MSKPGNLHVKTFLDTCKDHRCGLKKTQPIPSKSRFYTSKNEQRQVFDRFTQKRSNSAASLRASGNDNIPSNSHVHHLDPRFGFDVYYRDEGKNDENRMKELSMDGWR